MIHVKDSLLPRWDKVWSTWTSWVSIGYYFVSRFLKDPSWFHRVTLTCHSSKENNMECNIRKSLSISQIILKTWLFSWPKKTMAISSLLHWKIPRIFLFFSVFVWMACGHPKLLLCLGPIQFTLSSSGRDGVSLLCHAAGCWAVFKIADWYIQDSSMIFNH